MQFQAQLEVESRFGILQGFPQQRLYLLKPVYDGILMHSKGFRCLSCILRVCEVG